MSAEIFGIISRMLPQSVSLNEAIAGALNISYDAAHRRTSGKSKISLSEGLRLAAHFNFSLDALQKDQINRVAVEKTPIISTAKELEYYFKQSAISVRQLTQLEDVMMYYSAKDIPIFYLLEGNMLTRFKIYVWLRLLSHDAENVAFDNFNLPLSTLEAAKELGKLYAPISKTEIWDTTTFNSTLKQIHFYFEAGLLNAAAAKSLCDELMHLVNSVKTASVASEKFKLYHNELLLMNNTVLITSKHRNAFYVPFTFLSYFLAIDPITCKQADSYLQRQLSKSVLINTTGERARNIFFDRIEKRINALKQLVSAAEVLDFE
ncbi:MAG: hypothetical protein WBG46_08815 [Nonlabens sp.]